MDTQIDSISALIDSIKTVTNQWDSRTTPWFRGEPFVDATPLLPSLFRPSKNGKRYNENRILQSFRRLGPGFTDYRTPDRNAIDEWLFLMQHLRVPTRLLDWSEGALIALYFALEYEHPVVWTLNPDELNQLSVSSKIIPGAYPLTWFRPEDGSINIGHENIRGAWEENRRGMELPVAIKPTYIHPRMRAQKSCFTVHGKRQEPMSKMIPETILARFVIKEECIPSIRRDLVMLGITHTSIFPEAEFLAQEIKEAATIDEP